MTTETLRHLERGDHVRLLNGRVGCIQWFGKFHARWQRSARKRADGAWLWFPGTEDEGYVSAAQMQQYETAPLL